MGSRPFLIFHTLDDVGRHILKIQGDGIPLTERPLTLDDCLRFVKMFGDAAVDIVNEERRAREEERRQKERRSA